MSLKCLSLFIAHHLAHFYIGVLIYSFMAIRKLFVIGVVYLVNLMAAYI